MFDLLDGFPLGGVVVVITMVLIVLFFVTSSDSGSLVIDMLASGGDPNPPVWSRVFWASAEGAVAIALLLAGGLLALRTMAILIALPFSIIMLAMCVATWRAFRREHQAYLRAQDRQLRRQLTDHMEEHFEGRFEEVKALANGDGDGPAEPGPSRRRPPNPFRRR
jgi:choline/glycine/proline betaine transport protein